MLSKRQYKIRNSIRALFSLFLLSASIFSIQVYASNTTTYASPVDCQIRKPGSYYSYRFVSPGFRRHLQIAHYALCKRVKDDDRWDLDKGNRYMGMIVMRFGICHGNQINLGFLEYSAKRYDIGDLKALALTYERFCLDTYTPNAFGVRIKELKTRTSWLRNELFCQWTYEKANPIGFLEQLGEPDLPSIEKYQERTELICQDLRNGELTYEEAAYRWKQANIKYKQQLGPEMVKKMGRGLKKLIETYLELLK